MQFLFAAAKRVAGAMRRYFWVSIAIFLAAEAVSTVAGNQWAWQPRAARQLRSVVAQSTPEKPAPVPPARPVTPPPPFLKAPEQAAVPPVSVVPLGPLPQRVARRDIRAEPERVEPEQAPKGTIPVKRALVPFDAAKIALADAVRFDPFDAQFLRYIFVPYNADLVGYEQSINFTVNSVLSRSSFIQYGWRVHPQLIRYDLRLLAPVVADLQNLIDTFEELAFDPYFHEFVEVADDVDKSRDNALDGLKLLLGLLDQEGAAIRDKVAANLRLAKLQAELSRNRVFDLVFLNEFAVGKWTEQFYFSRERLLEIVEAVKNLRALVGVLAKQSGGVAKIEVKSRRSGIGALGINEEIPIPARHAGEAFELLTELLKTDAGIVRADYFLVRTLASIDIGHGAGLYYNFLGVQAGKNGLTDFQQLLADLGVSEEVIFNQRAQSSAAMFYSGVTGRTRKVIAIPSISIAPTRGTGLIVYTQDPSDEQVAAANEPLRNLIAFEFAAQEFIWERPNGTLGFDLFNAAGARQNSAPDNVVIDHQIPAPYTRRLYSGMSCLRCHGPSGGRMTVTNDVRKLTKGNVDILDDLSSADGLDDLLDRLVGEYEGDIGKPLQRSRDDFGEAAFRSTSGMRIGFSLDNSMVTYPALAVDKVCAYLAKVHIEYTYRPVTPAAALAELGYLVTNEVQATELLNQVMPNGFGITLLDPTIGALNTGIPVTRPAWELVFFDSALRAIITARDIAEGEIKGAKKGEKIGPVMGGTTSGPIWDKLAVRRQQRAKELSKGVHAASPQPRAKPVRKILPSIKAKKSPEIVKKAA